MQQSTWAIFFDLDQTLVMTAAIEQYRKNRQWSLIHHWLQHMKCIERRRVPWKRHRGR